MIETLEQQFEQQQFANGYALVDGVIMHAEHGDRFQISPEVIKRHIRAGQFVELRIDSPRFSVHPEASENCSCPSCNGKLTDPILKHDNPASLVPIPEQTIPSRGWGEDFWVKISERKGKLFKGIVDNPLVETRLHEVRFGDQIIFHEDNILVAHDIHRQELVLGMDLSDLKELAQWLESLKS